MPFKHRVTRLLLPALLAAEFVDSETIRVLGLNIEWAF